MKRLGMTAGVMIAWLAMAAQAGAETITQDMAVGCPSVAAYERFVGLVNAGSSQFAANNATGCKVSFKGDQVKVLEWRAIKGLVRVRPAWGGLVDFWYDSGAVSSN